MKLNKYQKKVLLEMLNSRIKDEQYIINKLTQTVNHNEQWIIPLTANIGCKKVLKSMYEVVKYAKRDIESNMLDLGQIKDIISQIKKLDDK